MLSFSNVCVYDIVESIVAAGFSMGTDYNEFEERRIALNKYYNNLGATKKEKEIATNELKRASRLVQASMKNQHVKCFDNFLTGIRVSFDMKYTQYITKQFQRYNWFDYVSSSSLMHRITQMNFDKCCNEYVTDETKALMKKYISAYNQILEEAEPMSNDGIEERKQRLYKAFMTVLSNCPMGTELFVRVSTNYKQLQTIYFQRRNHILQEDYGNFVSFVESLPLSNVLITGEKSLCN